MLTLKEFFDSIAVPNFLKAEFEKDDWYLMVGKLKNILHEEITQPELNSNSQTLICHGNVYIGKNCIIGDNVVIDGPAYIGNNVEIVTGAYIRAGSIIADGCSLGHAAEIKNSIMMAESKIANHTFLGDSIIGATARLGGHSETSNRKFDQTNVAIKYLQEIMETNLDKYGLILGEGSRLGGGVFTAPGTIIGKNTFVATQSYVDGYIPANMFVKTKRELEIRDNRFKGKLNSHSRFYN